MKRKQLIKDIIAFLILAFIFVFSFVFIRNSKINNNPSHEKIMSSHEKIMFYMSFLIYFYVFFITFGIYCYITFKITKGKWFIYKDPNKPKTLNNIDFGESCPSIRNCPKFSNYSKYLPSPFFFCISAPSWCYYVKFFQLLGVFTFLEKDFNKTINSHKCFPISV